MVKRRAKLLFHINMQPPAPLLSLHSAHMFLFKASRADYDDWCAHYPPAQCSVQRLTPKGSRGEAFPPNRTVDFPQGNFYRSSSHLLLSPSPTATSGSFYFLFYISPFCFCTAAFPFMPWNYARCILLPLQTILLPSLFCSSF